MHSLCESNTFWRCSQRWPAWPPCVVSVSPSPAAPHQPLRRHSAPVITDQARRRSLGRWYRPHRGRAGSSQRATAQRSPAATKATGHGTTGVGWRTRIPILRPVSLINIVLLLNQGYLLTGPVGIAARHSAVECAHLCTRTSGPVEACSFHKGIYGGVVQTRDTPPCASRPSDGAGLPMSFIVCASPTRPDARVCGPWSSTLHSILASGAIRSAHIETYLSEALQLRAPMDAKKRLRWAR